MTRLRIVDTRGIHIEADGAAILVPSDFAGKFGVYIDELVAGGYLRKASGCSGERKGYFDSWRDHNVYELTDRGKEAILPFMVKTEKSPEPTRIRGEEEH